MKMNKVILILVLGVNLSAQTIPNDKYFSYTIETTQTAEKVWETLCLVSQWKLWDKNVIDAKYGGPIQLKGMGKLITPSGRMYDFKIVDLKEGQTYTIKHKVSSGILFIKRTVRAADLGSRITEEVWFKGISKKTFSRYYGENYTGTLQSKLETLKVRLEE